MNALALLLSCTLPQDSPGAFLKKVDEAITRGVDWLKKRQQPEGHFGESSGPTYAPGQAYHNKPGITAFCLLALLKSDVSPHDPAIGQGFHFLQEYTAQKSNLISNKKGARPDEERVSGSMTCAGIGCLIIAKSILGKSLGKKRGEAVDQCVWDGFAWLQSRWAVAENPLHGKARHYYHLYGLERVGTLGLYEKVGPHWWYREGADVLLKDQQADGRWDNKDEIAPTDIIDTCYALLFLRRGTAPVGDVMTPRSEPKK